MRIIPVRTRGFTPALAPVVAMASLLLGVLTGPARAQRVAGAIEFTDSYTHTYGLAHALGHAGFDVVPIDASGGLPAGLDLLAIGTFATQSPDVRDWLSRNADAIRAFVGQGGTVLELTQADQDEAVPPFLPAGLEARRDDLDQYPVVVRDGAHPLVSGLPMERVDDQDRLLLPAHAGRTGSWETIDTQTGFAVLCALYREGHRPVLMEGASGDGRVVLTSLYPDKVLDQNGQAFGDPGFHAFSERFFQNVLGYVELVRTGRAPDVEPTVIDPIDPPDPTPGSFTIAVLPDTQVYAESHPDLFKAQTSWIAANAADRDIRFVIHEGDITNRNSTEQWQNARDAMLLLDQVPYALAPGNHDYGPGGNASDRTTQLNTFFPWWEQTGRPTFGGMYEPGRLDNSYHLFRAGGHDWIVLALEWGPRDAVLAWADRVLFEHDDRIAIVVTHAYTYFDDTVYDHVNRPYQSWNPHGYGTASDPGGTNDGAEIWEKCLRKHGNVAMVLSGHVLGDGTGRVTSTGDAGNTVEQILANFQMRARGGEGYMRLMEFLPDGKTVQVSTYSPDLDGHITHPDQQFRFELNVVPNAGCPDDVNDDGQIDVNDLYEINQHPKDVNADGAADSEDVACLERFVRRFEFDDARSLRP